MATKRLVLSEWFLRLRQQQNDIEQIAEQFDASIAEIKCDVQDFTNRLKGFLK